MLNPLSSVNMPGAVPGSASPLSNAVKPTMSPFAGAIRAAAPQISPPLMDAIKAPAPPPPGAPTPMVPAPPSPDVQDHDWITETQSDGSILLRHANPDGSPGPVVKIITGVKVPGAEAA